MSISEIACTYAALILHDDEISVTLEKINTLVKAAKVEVESYWMALFAKLVEKRNESIPNISTLIANVGSGGGGAPVSTAAAPVVEEKKEEPKEESDDDMGMPGGHGPYGSFPAGYNPSSAAAAGNSTANEEITASQFKENSVCSTGQQSEGPAAWIAAPDRDISGLPSPLKASIVAFTPT
ncbi:hypothetical protein VitviT2T_024419 [Vitis vinifera]|uniref:60S acidic ribosomal protein P1 n=1 Tax=Vitis vinifera TaxID=29760 RepID=A0ABY9DHM7_VITVI|nr:hypothetical protein VitviT2T_024419 [Vitis vinifera]